MPDRPFSWESATEPQEVAYHTVVRLLSASTEQHETGAGIFGWDALLQPIAGLVPTRAGETVATVRTATFALAVQIAVKWVVGIAMAATAR